MSRSDKLLNDGLKEMERILKRAVVGRIALCEALAPYIVPVNFWYSQGRIVFHCAWEGRKLDIISRNPNCCFEVDEFMGNVVDHHESRCHLDYDSVIAFGKARVLDNGEEKASLMQVFAEKYDASYRKPLSEGGKKFDETRVSECCCVVVDVEELTGRRERTVNGKREKTMWRHRFSAGV